MSKTEVKHSIATKKDRRYLTCHLTHEEVSRASDELARHLDEKEAIESELTAIKSQFKAKIEQADANIGVKKRLVRDKKEMRPVDVEVVSDYTDCTVKVTRTDTGEIIEDRKMTGDEKQLRIEFDETVEEGEEQHA